MKSQSVLLVHPDADVANGLAASLRAAGHFSVVVPSGEQAIDRFVQQPSDVVVVHLSLPGRDGSATVESIRLAPEGERVSVVLLGEEEQQNRLDELARKVRAVGTFAGEIDSAQLTALVDRLSEGDPTRVVRQDEVYRLLAITGATTQPAQVLPPGHDDDYEEDLDHPTQVDEPQPSGPWAMSADDDPVAAQEGRDVERRTMDLVQTKDALEGRLAEVPFPRLLAQIAAQRATGALAITAETDRRQTTTGETPKKVVFFRAGVPQHVRSNLVEECLGQVFARSQRISPQVLDESVRRVREGEGQQGGILVAMGAISPHELREALEEQQRLKLFDIFGWIDGVFRFSDRMAPPSETVTLELSLYDIVYEGVARKVSGQRLLDHLEPYLDRFVVPDPARLRAFATPNLSTDARNVLASIDGTRRLRDLLAIGSTRPGAAAQVVYALDCVSGVRFVDEPEKTAVALPTADDDASSAADLPLVDLAGLREELMNTLRLLRAEQYAQAFQLPKGTTDPVVVKAARERLDSRVRPLVAPNMPSRELRAMAYELLARLARAEYALLKGLGRDEQDEPPVPRDDDSTETYVHVDEADMEELMNDDSRVEPSPEANVLDDQVQRMFRAERHLRRGQDALRKEQFGEAIAAFEEAVRLCEDEGEFVAWLGYARYKAESGDPARAQEALEQLDAASQLAPKLDMVHVLRARVLRDRGDVVGARNAYERALAANPDCSEALTGLRELAR